MSQISLTHVSDFQTFSVRACTRAGAVIFVQIGAVKFSETCVRVRACVHPSKVCGHAAGVQMCVARPHTHFLYEKTKKIEF